MCGTHVCSGSARFGRAVQGGATDVPRESKKGLGRAESSSYRIRVPNDLKQDWERYVAEQGEDAPEAIRQVMRLLLNKPAQTSAKSSQPLHTEARFTTVDVVETGPKKAVKVMLTPTEHAAISTLAEERECSVQFWIVSLVRAALTAGHTVGGTELKRLGESNYQLMAIGRNLNQITHQINADSRAHLHRVTERSIEKLTAAIDAHRKHVHAVIDQCTHRWVIREPKQ